jgi:hypothetical protein
VFNGSGLNRCTKIDDILEEGSSIEDDDGVSDGGSDGGYLAASPDPNSPDSSFTLSGRIQNCFICRLSDSTVSEDARFEPRTVAKFALAVRAVNF